MSIKEVQMEELENESRREIKRVRLYNIEL